VLTRCCYPEGIWGTVVTTAEPGKEPRQAGPGDSALERVFFSFLFIYFNHFYVYSHVYTLFGTTSPPPALEVLTSGYVANTEYSSMYQDYGLFFPLPSSFVALGIEPRVSRILSKHFTSEPYPQHLQAFFKILLHFNLMKTLYHHFTEMKTICAR
jgi:hypothetical protein